MSKSYIVDEEMSNEDTSNRNFSKLKFVLHMVSGLLVESIRMCTGET